MSIDSDIGEYVWGAVAVALIAICVSYFTTALSAYGLKPLGLSIPEVRATAATALKLLVPGVAGAALLLWRKMDA